MSAEAATSVVVQLSCMSVVTAAREVCMSEADGVQEKQETHT